MPAGVEDLTPEQRAEWEERAAIMEFDGGLSRVEAEAVALRLVVWKSRAIGCSTAPGAEQSMIGDHDGIGRLATKSCKRAG